MATDEPTPRENALLQRVHRLEQTQKELAQAIAALAQVVGPLTPNAIARGELERIVRQLQG